MDAVSHEWLRSLYDRNRDVVFRYAVSRVGRDAALDVVSETFIEAGRNRAAFDPGRGSETSWLLGIATNRIRRLRRDENRLTVVGTIDDADGSEDAELIALPDRIDAERRSAIVLEAVDALPEGERAAILLHAVEGLDTAEVAESFESARPRRKFASSGRDDV